MERQCCKNCRHYVGHINMHCRWEDHVKTCRSKDDLPRWERLETEEERKAYWAPFLKEYYEELKQKGGY